jgi:hypothetical protein
MWGWLQRRWITNRGHGQAKRKATGLFLPVGRQAFQVRPPASPAHFGLSTSIPCPGRMLKLLLKFAFITSSALSYWRTAGLCNDKVLVEEERLGRRPSPLGEGPGVGLKSAASLIQNQNFRFD